LSHVAGGVAAVAAAAAVTDVVVYRRCGCFCILTVDRLKLLLIVYIKPLQPVNTKLKICFIKIKLIRK